MNTQTVYLTKDSTTIAVGGVREIDGKFWFNSMLPNIRDSLDVNFGTVSCEGATAAQRPTLTVDYEPAVVAAKNYYTGGLANAARLTRGLGF